MENTTKDNTSRNYKIILVILVICILTCAVSIWSLWYKAIDVSEKEKEIEKWKLEATSLRDSIESKNFELNLKSDSISIMLEKYKSVTVKDTVDKINHYYDTEKTHIINLPIDSTVSNLSKWLSEANKNK